MPELCLAQKTTVRERLPCEHHTSNQSPFFIDLWLYQGPGRPKAWGSHMRFRVIGLTTMKMDFTRAGPTVQMHGWYLQERRRQSPGLGLFLGEVGQGA